MLIIIVYMVWSAKGQKEKKKKDAEGNLIIDTRKQIIEWTNYIEILFHDTRPELNLPLTENIGSKILKEEVIYVIKHTKAGKVSGPDESPIELLKLIDDDSIDIVVDFFSDIYPKSGFNPYS